MAPNNMKIMVAAIAEMFGPRWYSKKQDDKMTSMKRNVKGLWVPPVRYTAPATISRSVKIYAYTNGNESLFFLYQMVTIAVTEKANASSRENL